MSKALRPYQQAAIDKLREAVRNGHRRVLLVLPTGGGKTVIALAVAQGHVAKGGRVLFLAHRGELVRQAASTFRDAGLAVRVIKAEEDWGPRDAHVVVASLQTLAAKRWSGHPLEGVSLVVIDEAHHGPAEQWAAVCRDYPTQLRIGLTATPVRTDGKPLGDVFSELIQVATVRELTDQGYLTECHVVAPAGRQSGVAELPEECYLQRIRPEDGVIPRRAIIFADLLASAERCVEALKGAGVSAGIVHGALAHSQRQMALKRFSSGEDRVLVNVMLLTEGWDDPGVSDCILARNCGSPALYLQIVGRILRLHADKPLAHLWDLTGAVHEHGLPDAEREYSLDGTPITLKDPEMLDLAQCLACGTCVRRPASGICPACGARLGRAKQSIEVKRAAMAAIAAAHTHEQREAYRQKLLGMARAKGYHQGWVSHMMRARYGNL